MAKKPATKSKPEPVAAPAKPPKKTTPKSSVSAPSGVAGVAPDGGRFGIRELRWADPKKLGENPRNWRTHPKRQLDALAASLARNGWAGALLFNVATSRLIDGHARRKQAIASDQPEVPVLFGYWTEEQERNLLATLDPITAMAEEDSKRLLDLTRMVESDLAGLSESVQATLQPTADLVQSLHDDAAVLYGGDTEYEATYNEDGTEVGDDDVDNPKDSDTDSDESDMLDPTELRRQEQNRRHKCPTCKRFLPPGMTESDLTPLESPSSPEKE